MSDYPEFVQRMLQDEVCQDCFHSWEPIWSFKAMEGICRKARLGGFYCPDYGQVLTCPKGEAFGDSLVIQGLQTRQYEDDVPPEMRCPVDMTIRLERLADHKKPVYRVSGIVLCPEWEEVDRPEATERRNYKSIREDGTILVTSIRLTFSGGKTWISLESYYDGSDYVFEVTSMDLMTGSLHTALKAEQDRADAAADYQRRKESS